MCRATGTLLTYTMYACHGLCTYSALLRLAPRVPRRPPPNQPRENQTPFLSFVEWESRGWTPHMDAQGRCSPIIPCPSGTGDGSCCSRAHTDPRTTLPLVYSSPGVGPPFHSQHLHFTLSQNSCVIAPVDSLPTAHHHHDVSTGVCRTARRRSSAWRP